MSPKFKPGDIVYTYNVVSKKYKIYKILEYKTEYSHYFYYDYETKLIMSRHYASFERPTFTEWPPQLLTEEKKLEIL